MSQTYPDLTYTTFPDNIQKFVEMVDINPENGEAIKEYQDAIQRNDINAAQQALIKIPNANKKILDSKKLNTVFDTCVALQNYFKNDILPSIEIKQQEWQNIIQGKNDDIGYKGEYTATITYAINNIVSYQGLLYISLANSNNAVPTDILKWRNLIIKGEDGLPGMGLAFLGDWNSSINYQKGNVVSYDGKIWESISANIGQEPIEGSAFWLNSGSLSAITITISSGKDPETEYWFEVI